MNTKSLMFSLFCFTTILYSDGNLFARSWNFRSREKAQEESPPVDTAPSFCSSFLQVGGNYSHVNISTSGSPSVKGNLGGAQALYEYRSLGHFYAGAKLAWRQGNTKGDDISRFLVDIDSQERLGYVFTFKERRYLLTLFSGFGFRYLEHNLRQNHASMKMKYREYYVPVGALADFKINSLFSMGVYGTWMPQVDPTVGLIPIGGAHWSLKKKLTNFLVEVPFYFFMGSKRQYAIVLKPFYEYWQDGHSTATTTTGLPLGISGNTYNFWGTELNFGYKF